MQKNPQKVLTGFPVLLIFSVESMHSLQQLPLLAAAGVIDKVPSENLFQLTDREVLYRLFIVEIRQRGSDPSLCRRADLQSTQEQSWDHRVSRRTAFTKTSRIEIVSLCRCL